MKKIIFVLFACYNIASANYNIFDHTTIQHINLPFVRETEHFRLYCTPADSVSCQKVLDVAEKNFKQCSHDFNHSYSAKINFYIFPCLQDLHNAVGQPHAPDRVANIYKPEIHSFFTVNPERSGSYHSTESLLNLNMHGITSLFIQDKYHTNIPFWFTHGIGLYRAHYIDPKIVNQLLQNPQLIPSLQQLEDFDSSSDSYRACSYLMIEFINNQWGWDTMLAVLADYGSFEKILGISKEKFKNQFIDYLKKEKTIKILYSQNSGNS